MLSLADLQEAKPPWVILVAREAEPSLPGLTVRAVDSARMRSTPALFSEFAAELEFPRYFGRNWDAFEECLLDLSWLPPGPYAVVVEHAAELLADAPPEEFALFIRLIENVATQWALPVGRGERWDRPAVAFHLVLQEAPHRCDALRTRVQDAGTEVEDLDPGSDPT